MPESEYTRETALRYLARLLRDPDEQTEQMIRDRDAVYRVYGRLFHPDNLEALAAEDLIGFLLYEHNRHWWGIHRHQKKLVADMAHTREVLRRLLEESEPVVERLDWIEGAHAPKPLPGLGKAVHTPILHVVYPDRYGVWNSIAESAMRRLALWPDFGWGWTFGQQYVAVNDALVSAASELRTDLWTVDSLWWRVENDHEPTKHQFIGTGSGTGSASTGRQAHSQSTFVCERCFMTKAENLRSASESSICLDCGS